MVYFLLKIAFKRRLWIIIWNIDVDLVFVSAVRTRRCLNYDSNLLNVFEIISQDVIKIADVLGGDEM